MAELKIAAGQRSDQDDHHLSGQTFGLPVILIPHE